MHRNPIDRSPSSLLSRYAEEIAPNTNGVILDVACGYGRNAECIASYGVPVTCLDVDVVALQWIDSEQARGLSKPAKLTTRKINLRDEPWPPVGTNLHKLTIRIDPELAQRFDAYSQALDKTYRDLLEPVLVRTLDEMKLTPDQHALVKAHLRLKRSRF